MIILLYAVLDSFIFMQHLITSCERRTPTSLGCVKFQYSLSIEEGNWPLPKNRVMFDVIVIPQSLQEDVRLVFQIRRGLIPSSSRPVHYSLDIPTFISTCSPVMHDNSKIRDAAEPTTGCHDVVGTFRCTRIYQWIKKQEVI
jgi:hypothetical protein